MKRYDIIREYFPDATDEECELIVWEKTGFPSFWNSVDGETPEECFRTQVKRFRDELKAKKEV